MIFGKENMSKMLMIFKKIGSTDEYQENKTSFLRKAICGMKEIVMSY